MSDPMTTAPNNVLVRCWQALWIDRERAQPTLVAQQLH
mgnify:CR=1 FL=1